MPLAKNRELEHRDVSPAGKPALYHYEEQGLKNIYLAGVQYRIDRTTGEQLVHIPQLPKLWAAIAKALLKKTSLLLSEEIRFLRKQLMLPSKTFAEYVGVSPEQYSRIENGATVTQSVDRLVRLLYVKFSRQPLKKRASLELTLKAAQNLNEKIIITYTSRLWVVEESPDVKKAA